MNRKQITCRCGRHAFPHRYERPACDRHIDREIQQETRSESDRLYWADYHDRVRDLRRELA